jgi:hypothetical protein
MSAFYSVTDNLLDVAAGSARESYISGHPAPDATWPIMNANIC